MPFNLQNSLTNSNGTVFRTMLKIVQKNPPELLQISVGNIKKFADKIREDILIRVTGVFPNLQIRPQSAISNDTYFENNHGFKEAQLLVEPISATYSSRIYDGFLSKNVKSPYMIPNRGFKSKRHDIDKQKSLFDQHFFKEEEKTPSRQELGSIFNLANQDNEQVKSSKSNNQTSGEKGDLNVGEFLYFLTSYFYFLHR